MVVEIGDVWRPYVKKTLPSYKGDIHDALILRKVGVHRKSKNVIAVNEAFREAAKKCANKPLREFQACIAKELQGRKFRVEEKRMAG